jgi:hypothetical protein
LVVKRLHALYHCWTIIRNAEANHQSFLECSSPHTSRSYSNEEYRVLNANQQQMKLKQHCKQQEDKSSKGNKKHIT